MEEVYIDLSDKIFIHKDFVEVVNLKIPKGNILDFIHYCFVEFKLEPLLKANNYDQISLIFEDQALNYLSIINQKPIEHE